MSLKLSDNAYLGSHCTFCRVFSWSYTVRVHRSSTVKLLLSDHWMDHQKAVAEEKVSPNATKVHHTKRSDSIYYTLTTQYFQQNPMLLVLI